MIAVRLVALVALTAVVPARMGQTPAPTGALAGRVFDADTGAPLEGVQVGSARSGWRFTGSDGRYVLPDLRPGPFEAWVRGDLIAVAPAAPKHAAVVAGQTRAGVDFHVRLHGSISGRVVDDRGAPLAGMRVVVVGREYGTVDRYGTLREFATGELRYYGAASATTNADGAFAIDRVAAGRPYRLIAFQPKRTRPPQSPAPSPEARSFLATYFPAASTYEEAAVVRVSSFERRSGVEIRMTRRRSYCVTAAIPESGGGPQAASFVLEEDEVFRIDAFSSRASFRGPQSTDVAGQLRVCGVAPGAYRLAIGDGQTPFDSAASGVTDLTVIDRDVHVQTFMRPAVPLTTEVGWADPADRARGGITIEASPAIEALTGERAFPSSFPVLVTPHRRYSLRIGLPAAFYVQDARYDGTSILDGALVPAGSLRRTLSIIVARGAGAVTTEVRTAEGTPSGGSWVFLLPASAGVEAGLAASMIVGVSGADGQVAIGGLRPGAYHVVAVDVPPPGTVQLPSRRPCLELWPETMQRLLRARSTAPRVEVAPGRSVQTTVVATLALR